MATGTFYLRPTADILLGHSVVPETLEVGYSAINEEVNDALSTYIEDYISTSDTKTAISSFRMGLNNDKNITTINSAFFRFYMYADNGGGDGGTAKIIFAINDKNNNEVWSCCATYKGYDVTINLEYNGSPVVIDNGNTLSTDFGSSDLATVLNNMVTQYGTNSLSELVLTITTTVSQGDSSKNDAIVRISQAIFGLECEYAEGLNINHKVNGEWKAATAAYQKQNGAWVEITEDECKSILSGSFITK